MCGYFSEAADYWFFLAPFHFEEKVDNSEEHNIEQVIMSHDFTAAA